MVLQILEIPPRPVEYDGALCLFGLVEGCSESAVRACLKSFGKIVSYEAGAGSTPTVVRFSTHEAALAVRSRAAAAAAGCCTEEEETIAVSAALGLTCTGADTLYNERSYEGREGDQSRDDDKGRGWCAARVRTCAPWVIPEPSSARV